VFDIHFKHLGIEIPSLYFCDASGDSSGMKPVAVINIHRSFCFVAGFCPMGSDTLKYMFHFFHYGIPGLHIFQLFELGEKSVIFLQLT
jgi:hypothetical protein